MGWVLLFLGLAVLAHTAPFPFLLDAVQPRRVMWKAPPSAGAPTIYLTFDDGPNPTATPRLLDVLARVGVRATFFIIPVHVTDAQAELVRRLFDEGHGVGLHTGSRRLVWSTTAETTQWLEQSAAHVEALTGRRPCRAFRPHGGWRSAAMLAGLAQADYQLVGWGWNAWDFNWFRPRTAEATAGRLVTRASDGLIAVIHDGHHEDPAADRNYAVAAVAALVPVLKAKGFRFGSICEALEAEQGSPGRAQVGR
jgi:chitooligosaccharide deacetylase